MPDPIIEWTHELARPRRHGVSAANDRFVGIDDDGATQARGEDEPAEGEPTEVDEPAKP